MVIPFIVYGICRSRLEEINAILQRKECLHSEKTRNITTIVTSERILHSLALYRRVVEQLSGYIAHFHRVIRITLSLEVSGFHFTRSRVVVCSLDERQPNRASPYHE